MKENDGKRNPRKEITLKMTMDLLLQNRNMYNKFYIRVNVPTNRVKVSNVIMWPVKMQDVETRMKTLS